jgi:integrase
MATAFARPVRAVPLVRKDLTSRVVRAGRISNALPGNPQTHAKPQACPAPVGVRAAARLRIVHGQHRLRPDEAARLEYRDAKIVKDYATGETILEIEVRGKRGVGYCKSTSGAVLPFRRLVKRNEPQPTDRIFPKTHRDLFNTILDEVGLKFDREGNRRTAYSLRHTYVCLRLMEGADIYQIAKNCRTSVEMIEKYYAHQDEP